MRFYYSGMKPFICALLAILLMASGVQPAMALTMDQEEALAAGPDVYMAWYLRNYVDYGGVVEQFGTATDVLYDNVNSVAWQAELLAWRTANFKLSDLVTTSDKEIGYYEMKLLNILFSTTVGQDSPELTVDLKGSAKDIQEKLQTRSAKAVSQLCEVSSGALTPAIIYDMEIAHDMKKADEAIQWMRRIDGLGKAMKIIDVATKYLDSVKTIGEMVEKLTMIEMLLESREELADLLRDLIRLNGDVTNLPLNNALQDMLKIYTEELTEDQIRMIFAEEKGYMAILEESSKWVWRTCMSMLGGYGLAVSAGQAIGKMESDILFNTSEVIAQFYQLDVMRRYEELFRREFAACEAALQANPTPENARKYVYSFRMLIGAYLEGADTVIDYLDASFADGAMNTTRSFFEGLLNWQGGDYERYQQDRAYMETLKDRLNGVMTDFERHAYSRYVEELLLRPWLDSGGLDFTRMEGDVVTQQGMSSELPGLSYVDGEPVVTGNMTLEKQYIFPGNLTLERGTLDMNGLRLVVMGDLYINGGTLDLNGNVLTVFGNVYHRGGTVKVHHGSLMCGGDYLMVGADSDLAPGRERYTYSEGFLYMAFRDDVVQVGGRLIWKSDRHHGEAVLAAGGLYVAGDMEEFGHGLFSPGEQHVTVLNGREKQVVFFDELSGFGAVRFDNPRVEFRKFVSWKRLIGELPAELDDTMLTDDSAPGGAEAGDEGAAYDPSLIEIGQIVFYGEYAPYDGMEGTERQPIRWRVLDNTGDAVLLLSEEVLFSSVMDNGGGVGDERVEWDECSMRTWHLADFVEEAFNQREKYGILTVPLDNSNGVETKDGVFLLSLKEIERYLPRQEDRIARATPSARINGWLEVNAEGCAYWWTRTTGEEAGYYVCVRPDGQVKENGEWGGYSFYGVRPALWVRPGTLIAEMGIPEEAPAEEELEPGDGENALAARVLREYKGDGALLEFGYADYDGDGAMEAFALIGVYDDENFRNEAELWYVCAEYAVQCELAGGCYPWDSGLVTVDGRTCFSVSEGYFGSGGATRRWAVRDGRPCLVDGEYMLEDLNVAAANLARAGK